MTSPEPTQPGEALRDLLEERGISQIRAAQALGISRGHLNSIINGHNPISAEIKLKLHDFLDVPPQHWTRLQEKQDAFAATPEGREHLQSQQRREFLEQLQMRSSPRLDQDSLRLAIDCGWLGIEPFSPARLSRAGYWLGLGLRGIVTRQKDPAPHPEETEVLLKPRYELAPGAVLSVLTLEKIRLPEEVEMRFATAADVFCGAGLALRCRQHFEGGLEAPISLQIINESGRPQTLRFQDPAVFMQFEHHPAELSGPP